MADFRLPSYLFSENGYFKIHKKDGTKVAAQCRTCRKIINGSSTSTGNFLSHLTRVHPDLKKEIEAARSKHKNANYSDVRKIENQNNVELLSKEKAKESILTFFSSEFLPLRTVEMSSFQNLLRVYGSNGVYIPDRQELIKHLELWHANYKTILKQEISQQNFMCSTVDIWNSSKKSFLGMTINYMEANTFGRISRRLACKRIKNFETLESIIKSIYHDFGINGMNITSIVTKDTFDLLKTNGIDSSSSIKLKNNSGIKQENLTMNEASCDHEDGSGYDGNILSNHFTCSASSLNLVATKDASQALLNSTDYKSIHEASFSKIQTFWNLLNTTSNIFFELNLPSSNFTDWNSTYIALKEFLNLKEELTEDICLKLNLPKFESNQLRFFEEYCKVMEPLSSSLDWIQAKKTSYLGYLAPTIILLTERISRISNLIFCEPLKDAVLKGIRTRFDYVFDLEKPESRPFILASISHPRFKLNWIPDEDKTNCSKLFRNECSEIATNLVPKEEWGQTSSTDIEEDFFGTAFLSTVSLQSGQSARSNERNESSVVADAFLVSPKTDLLMLNSFKIVKNVFIKYNTTLPSSTSVNRLFSSTSKMLAARKIKWSDQHFEMLLTCRDSDLF